MVSLLDIHRALWTTYLVRQRGIAPTDLYNDLNLSAHLKLGTVETLTASDELKIPRSLLGIALWNLLAGYKDEKDEKKAPAGFKDFTTLLKTVLDLDFEQAKALLRSPQVQMVFPKYPAQVVLDASWQLRDDLEAATVHLELSVDQPFQLLGQLHAPPSWMQCELFWRNVTKKGDSAAATVQLPDPISAKPIDLELQISGPGDSPFEARTDFAMPKPNAGLEVYRGYLSTQKAPGRPGVTRIISERSVRFAPGILNDFRLMTLAYWLQAEIAYLVLSETAPAKAPSPKTSQTKSGSAGPKPASPASARKKR